MNRFLRRTLSTDNLARYSLSRNHSNKIVVSTADRKEELENTMRVIADFITPEEEESLMEEIDPYMRRLRYEQSHWDDVNIITMIKSAPR